MDSADKRTNIKVILSLYEWK